MGTSKRAKARETPFASWVGREKSQMSGICWSAGLLPTPPLPFRNVQTQRLTRFCSLLCAVAAGCVGQALFRSSQLRWQLQAGPITCLPDLYDPALVEKGNKLRYDAMHFTMRHGNFTGGHWFGFV